MKPRELSAELDKLHSKICAQTHRENKKKGGNGTNFGKFLEDAEVSIFNVMDRLNDFIDYVKE